MRRVCALAALVLTACGGGGADAAPEACRNTVAVQLFGDSTMVGYVNGNTIAAKGPGALLQETMDARFGAGRVAVTSRAVAGTTLPQLVAGTDGLNRAWPLEVTGQVVVVNHGINDRRLYDDVAQYRAALAVVARTPGVLLETPNKVAAFDLGAYAQAMRDTGLPVADTFALTVPLGDSYHPTQEAYVQIVRDSLAPVVAQRVAALLCKS